jgi:hypothetical protein
MIVVAGNSQVSYKQCVGRKLEADIGKVGGVLCSSKCGVWIGGSEELRRQGQPGFGLLKPNEHVDYVEINSDSVCEI